MVLIGSQMLVTFMPPDLKGIKDRSKNGVTNILLLVWKWTLWVLL